MADPTPLPTSNTAAKIADKTVLEIVSIATTAAETAAIAYVPALGFPVIKQLWEALFQWITGLIGTALGTEASFIVMDVQKYLDLHAAASALASLSAAQKSGDQTLIQKANSDADDALASLVHYIGDAHS